MLQAKRKIKRIAQTAAKKDLPLSLAHLNDSLGYELPHALKHAKQSISSDPALRKRNVEHTVHHIQDAMKHNKKLTKKLMLLPSVKKLMKELARDSRASGGPA